MDITSPEGLAAFANDVRQQEAAFVRVATDTFRALIVAEYRRLRASGLERGDNCATLTVQVSCNFAPNCRTIDMQSFPAAVSPKPNRKGASFG